MRTVWFSIGLGSAFVTALLPVLVALLHLLPAVLHTEPGSHHQHARHTEAGPVHAQAHLADYQVPDAPREQPRQTAGHCPLCFWLQGFHALPPSHATAAPVAAGTVTTRPWYEPAFVTLRFSITAQPRAPPVSLPA
jgi:hypothetical protein